MEILASNNHFTGYYITDKNTYADNYRHMRQFTLNFLNDLKEEYRLSYIEGLLKSSISEFNNKYPDQFEYLIEQNHINDIENIDIDKSPKLLEASFIIFLQILVEKYKQIEKHYYGEILWLKDFNSFQNFYRLLHQNNIIECRFDKFKSFFSGNETLNFNSNIFETISIFFGLIDAGYISSLTIERFIKKGSIIVTVGKSKIFRIIGQKEYVSNKKKYYNDDTQNIINPIILATMLKFGIILKKHPEYEKLMKEQKLN